MSRFDETCTPTSIAELSTPEYIQISIDESEFRIFSSGIIHRLMKSGNWKEITNKINHKQGYNVIMIKKKQYMRGRIVAHAYLNMDLYDKRVIHHINQNRMDCSVNNLIINDRSYSQLFCNTNKGWTYNKNKNKYVSLFTRKGVTQKLGEFDTAQEAHERYEQERTLYKNNILNS